MKVRFFLILVLELALIYPAIAKDKPVWKGKIGYENGIKVVENPDKPPDLLEINIEVSKIHKGGV